MISNKVRRLIFFVLLCAAVSVSSANVLAQESNQSPRPAAGPAREDETNLETQLYLILATNRDTEDGKMPLALEPVLARLHESLAFKHYALAATFLNRVSHNGYLEMTWVGGPLLAPSSSPMGNPSFNQFTAQVRLSTDDKGREIVRMNKFTFGSRVPIITAQPTTTTTATGGSSFPVINYESVGLRTDISMREGVPVIAGTLNVGPSGDAIVVVIAAKRAAN